MHPLLQHIKQQGVVAILRGYTASQIVPLGRALRAAGVGAMEVTLNSPNALDQITMLKKELGNEIPVGAGTVMSAAAAKQAIEAGAMFVLMPHLGEDVIAACIAAGIPVVPGVMSVTEMVKATSLRAEMVKVFPAATLGPGYFKDVRGPLPEMQMMAVGGINGDNAEAFIRAGAVSLGVGSLLVDAKAVAAEDWQAVTRQAEKLVAAVRRARS
jgi:2-dehydro-3-deoxyphosphogluconate aldolase/(4S)-4-hydroxy-2-oxoglutarate aldolase